MTNKELAVWCLGYFIAFVWIVALRGMSLHPFLELNFTLWICCATLILSHDAVKEMRKNATGSLNGLI